ncbi:MAG: hypothetical protein A3H32_17150 [Betaproteobacteria bacterium RIFCSPLOWO2_02_FULL_63_19]|nr:MAG: hypothetical protein A3H32_17150 [Betaproteobacteria bacterium RIFCSPLOWO2_02_FULL_63_19]
MAEEGRYGWSYAETIADHMKIFFDAPGVSTANKAEALRIAIIAAYRQNRFTAMDTCYSWSFVQPGVLVVLNLWFSSIVEANGAIKQHLKFRGPAARTEENAARRARRRHLEKAVALAYRAGLPVRVIVLDGTPPRYRRGS